MEIFKLNTDYIELCDLLKICGPCVSGGEAKLLIKEGKVQVDGQIDSRKKAKIRTGQIVKINPFTIHVV